jgi:hypothetical protein
MDTRLALLHDDSYRNSTVKLTNQVAYDDEKNDDFDDIRTRDCADFM